MILSSDVKLISQPSNFVENNYFRFNVCYSPLKFAFKNSVERIHSGEFFEPIWYLSTNCHCMKYSTNSHCNYQLKSELCIKDLFELKKFDGVLSLNWLSFNYV